MEPINLRKLKRPKLIELAAHFKVKRRHRLRKRDLIKLLEKLLPQAPEKLSLVFQHPREAQSSSRHVPSTATAPGYADRGAPLPLDYGQDRITALVRDPNALYIYWELKGPRGDQVLRECGRRVFDDASWVLRLHQDNERVPRDIPVIVEGCSWYLPVAENCTYVVEIGIIPRGGRFISFAMSNRVCTPATGLSEDTSCEWMMVEEDFNAVRLGAKGPRVSAAFADTLAERFRTPDFGSRFLGGSERVPGSPRMTRPPHRAGNK